ncbi:uncharacterized protein LOC130749856 isoform X2 [Lotus japonicus]|nr:uncharacterized protein LOC130749856 isoform X2 [Lotus japonicus]
MSHSNHDLEQSNVDNSTRMKRGLQCGAKPSSEYHWVRKHQPDKKDFLGQEIKEDMVTYGRKHFNINMKSDILTFLHDPVSPTIYHFHKQQMRSAKMALTRSASFPLPDSSSERARSEVISNASLPKRQGSLCFGSKTQKLVQLKSSKVFCEEAALEWRLNGNSNINEATIVRNVNSSSGYSQCQKRKEIKHVKNLKQKIELVTGENKREKLRVTNDAIIDKLPQGHEISDELKKEILKKLTEPSCNESHSRHRIRRIWSLPEPLESYSKLHEKRFKTEARFPQSKKPKLRTEMAHSPFRIRILSLPDLQSFSYGDGTMISESGSYQQKRLDLNVHSRNQVQTHVENLIQENLVSEGENDLVVRSNIMGSGSDCSSKINDNLGIIVNDFGDSSLRKDGTSNDQDSGAIKEDKAAIAESDSKSKPGPVDRLDNVAEQQEANMDPLGTTENAQKVEILNYEIPQFQVDTRHKDEFNYVKYVLEVSGLTGNDCLSAWHSSDQPVDPLLYEEMEGDPEFCTGGQCNHYVLFDLINESLLDIYGRSYNCCYNPTTPSSSSLPLIHPMPGCHIVSKVWARMSRSLCLRFRGGQTVDDHVGRDLAKLDELVNLQFFAESVGLEVEDLIFQELLKEIVGDLA